MIQEYIELAEALSGCLGCGAVVHDKNKHEVFEHPDPPEPTYPTNDVTVINPNGS